MIFNCIEACYWHLIEKRFCYDESIALYEEPLKPKIENNTFENMAFYDQVSLIAGRAIVTIDPLPKQPKPIEHQPVRRVRWWEDNVDEQNKENEAKNIQCPFSLAIPTIMESSREDLTSSTEELDSINDKKIDNSINVTDSKTEENNTPSNSDAGDSSKTQNSQSDSNLQISSEPVKPAASRKSSSALLSINEEVKLRKKSLRERRMSRSLTLNIDRNLELPIIRQVSMPKFYIDTPEANQLDSSVLMTPSATLMSPILPRSTQNDSFDLRSVVQLENEYRAQVQSVPVPVHKQLTPPSRLSQIKEKLKSTKIKRQGSATNLPNSIQHI
ncbi:hypothetical protein ILUMI_22884 [Ignelater luminosus]|uniref:Uncharacterized protein n=1 Tax=Ignelater luminosus TaxID=2038154 RepID=A0A8K0C979_IGNLU|nr:hypothetical protein ILUMI_22884 [Ignelater luminosus]